MISLWSLNQDIQQMVGINLPCTTLAPRDNLISGSCSTSRSPGTAWDPLICWPAKSMGHAVVSCLMPQVATSGLNPTITVIKARNPSEWKESRKVKSKYSSKTNFLLLPVLNICQFQKSLCWKCIWTFITQASLGQVGITHQLRNHGNSTAAAQARKAFQEHHYSHSFLWWCSSSTVFISFTSDIF